MKTDVLTTSSNFLQLRLRRLMRGGLLVLPLIGAGCDNQSWMYDHSAIARGVPAQIEGHGTSILMSKSKSTLFFVRLEQCTEDVKQAKAGLTVEAPSFDPDLGEVGEGCKVDEVYVDEFTYKSFTDGATVIVQGKPGGSIIENDIVEFVA